MLPLRRAAAAAVALATAAVLAACTPTAPAPDGGGPPAGLERYYEQELDFGTCEDPGKAPAAVTPECATVEVPVDYETPDGTTMQLELHRYPARGDDRIGSVLFNPGGPGSSSTRLIPVLAEMWANTPMAERFDLIGFDPRGVGKSDPAVDCFTDAERDADAVTGGVRLGNPDLSAAEACADSLGEEAMAHLGTRDVARDMDVLRAALGDDKLTYTGISYGTRLGAVYAEMFPGNVRALVLDGPVDPTLGTAERELDQYGGLQMSFERMAAQCAAQADCPLGTDPAQATAEFQALVRPLLDSPVPAGDDRQLTYIQALDGFVQGMYNDKIWPRVIAGLTELRAGRGDTILELRDAYHGRSPDGTYPNDIEAVLAINCLDEERVVGAELDELTAAEHRAAPIFDPGRPLSIAEDPCAGWPSEPTLGIPYATDLRNLTDTLTIASTGDALTPYESAVNLPKMLGGSLLTVESEAHGVLLTDDDCVEAVVADYLVDLKSPPADAQCSS